MKLEDTQRELQAAMGLENDITGDYVVIPKILPIVLMQPVIKAIVVDGVGHLC